MNAWFVIVGILCLNSVAIGRPQHDSCPKIPANSLGTCEETCSGDFDCDPGERCCSNGCGHTCMQTGNVCGGKIGDIVFILDESSSIWNVDFKERQLKFVSDVVDNYDIGPKKIQVGVLSFADNVNNHFYLNSYKEKSHIKKHIGAIDQRAGNTYTDRALLFLRKSAFASDHGARTEVPHIGILMTDGKSHNTTATIAQATLAKQAGIKMFVLGIGPDVNDEECKAIASEPAGEHYRHVAKFKDLKSFEEELVFKSCIMATTTTQIPTTTPPQMIEGCDGATPLDVVFALSENGRSKDINTELDFIKSLAAKATISPENVQFGLTEQPCKSKDEIELGDCSSGQVLKSELEKRKWKAATPEVQLLHMRERSFTEAKGARAKSVKFGVIIVDEKLAYPPRAIEESEYVKAKAELIVISVGTDVKGDQDTLKEMASSSKHYFHVDNYDDLTDLNRDIEKLFCDGVKNGKRREELELEMFN